MLAFAQDQVGKPFSNSGMARSVVFPRQSTLQTFYCAGAARAPFSFAAGCCGEPCQPTFHRSRA